MPLDRALIIRAPAIVQYGGVTVWTNDDIVCTPQLQFFDVGTSVHGPQADRRLIDVAWEIAFTPVVSDFLAWWEAVYFPFSSWVNGIGPGGSVFGGTDKPLVIWAKNGNRKYTFATAMSLRPGELTFAANKLIFGQTAFTAIRKNNTAWAVADSLLKVETATYPVTAFDSKQPMSVNWPLTFRVAGVPVFGPIDTVDGVTIQMTPNVQPVPTDAMGTVDYSLQNVAVTASFTPALPLDLMALLKVQGLVGLSRGVSVQDFGEGILELDHPAELYRVAVSGARPVSGLNQFGSTNPLVGRMTFEGRWMANNGSLSLAEL